MSKDRCEIHTHTTYSNTRLIDAINTPEMLINKAIEIGLKGIAITDHEILSAHPQANKIASVIAEKHPDFKVILGNEIYLVDERPQDKHYHFILLAKDAIGHKQLRILSSLAWMNMYETKRMERVDTLKSDLERIICADPGHVIGSSACIGGELGSRILSLTSAEKIGDTATAQQEHNAIVNFVLWCKKVFKDDFYIECQPGVSKEQIIVNKRLVNIAKAFDLKLVCSSDAHYLTKEDRYVHKSFLQSKEGEREVDAFYQDAYLHTNEEMIEKFALSLFDKNLVESMFDHTMEIYAKIENYSLAHPQKIPQVEVKDYPKLKNSTVWERYPEIKRLTESDDKIERNWVHQCLDKLVELGKDNDTYYQRLNDEVRVKRIIGEKLGTNIFAYPITLQYYINKFWELGSTVGAGRGSSCSGLNHYLLGVTQLDPIEWKLPFWRYLNEDRAELPDIDVDLAPSKRPAILNYIKEERGRKFYQGIDEIFKENLGATYVATFGTETAKSAITTACRGYRSEDCKDGVDNDIALYLSSLIPVERGEVWSLKDVYVGNEEKGRKPVPAFIQEVNQYPGLMEVAFGIENCISRRGIHASGVIFYDEDPFEFSAFMRSPNGDVCTQYDLHDAEWCGCTKYDFLVTEVQDKITETIHLLQENGEIESELTLKEIYDKYLHPSVLPIDDERIWKAIQNVEVLDLFQFDSIVGSQATKKIKPSTILELADANGLMRLTPADKNDEAPMDKYVRFKNDISLWRDEMLAYGLTKEEMETVKPYFASSYGVPPSQEQLMQMVMDKDICNFSLKEANDIRKVLAKKQTKRIPEMKDKVLSRAKRPELGKYIWNCGVKPQMTYSFSIIHALAYSFIGFQTAYLAVNWNPIYWNTACLIVNSGSLEDNDKSTDYGKIGKAIGMIRERNIEVSLININESAYGFKPDVENNRILYGLKAVAGINPEAVEKIETLRPFTGIKDFMLRCPLKVTGMVNLIKSGAFDEIDVDFNSRKEIMIYYLIQKAELKKKLNMQNFAGLIRMDLIPKELEKEVRIYNFTKYIRTKKVGQYYTLDEICIQFLEKFLPDILDHVEQINNVFCIKQAIWDNAYKNFMLPPKNYITQHQQELLAKVNDKLFLATWEKYAKGTYAKWEMDSLCFYYTEHELKDLDYNKYGITSINDMPEEPEVDNYWVRGNKRIPIFKLYKIAGTVVSKNDTKHTLSFCTREGMITVKFSRDLYAMFKKQISVQLPNGKKQVMEKSWFKRGNKLLLTGFRRDDTFVIKTYKNTGSHAIYIIDEINNKGEILIRHERFSTNNQIEEDEGEQYD